MTSSLALFLDTVQPHPSGRFQAKALPDWSQGRTLYGGATAALCARAVELEFAELPPLRSSQFCFVGPSAGELALAPRLLRQGRSSSVVEVEVRGDDGVAAKALLVYGAARDSSIRSCEFPAPDVLPPQECPEFFGGGGAPTFTAHFEFRKAGGCDPVSRAARGEFLAWVRHREPGAVSRSLALLAIGDALPPAAMAMFDRLAPVSSLTWGFDLLTDELPETADWLLLSAVAEVARDGYSYQKMAIWDQHGRAVASGRQQVTLFC